MEEQIIGKIKTSQIQGKKGCIITFITNDNVITGNNVSIKFENKTHYFEVSDIKITDDNKLLVEANEVGYWATKLGRKSDFDLRTLTNVDISLITDKALLSKINEMSCWC